MKASRKPHLKRFIICLCLASVLVVAVAWGSSFIKYSYRMNQDSIGIEGEALWASIREGDWPPDVSLHRMPNPSGAATYVSGSQYVLATRLHDIVIVELLMDWNTADGYSGRLICRGLPFRAIEWKQAWTRFDGSRTTTTDTVDVLYPGFIGNAFVYAVVMWGVWTGFVAFKRRRRVRRGLCPTCTYDLTGLGSAECPECGESLPLATAKRG